MRPLLIGEAPGPNTLPEYPLFPAPLKSAGGRLPGIMGISRAVYLQTFDRMNLILKYPGPKWPAVQARENAKLIRPLLTDRHVVMVGRNVSRAFGFEELPWHKWALMVVKGNRPSEPRHVRLAVVPHPSGRNRWYNDEAHCQEALGFWLELLVRFGSR